MAGNNTFRSEDHSGLEVFHVPRGFDDAPESVAENMKFERLPYARPGVEASPVTTYAAGSPTSYNTSSLKGFDAATHQHYDPPLTSIEATSAGRPKGDRYACVMRKRTVWIIAITAIILVLALAVGLGVGLTVGKGVDKSTVSLSPAPTNSNSNAPAESGTGTAAAASPTATVAAADISALRDCPRANETVYVSSGAPGNGTGEGTRFQVLCGLDYDGKDGNSDLFSFKTDSFPDCIDSCAGQPECVGAGWGFYDNKDYVCWLKQAELTIPSVHDRWIFARFLGEGDP